METAVLRLTGIALIGMICAVALRKYSPTIGMVAALAAGVLLLFEAAGFFSPLADLLARLQEISGISAGVFAPLIKVGVISVVSRIVGELCRDCSQDGLAAALETAALIISLAIASPVFIALFEAVGRYL